MHPTDCPPATVVRSKLRARLSLDAADAFANGPVAFHYGGDPSREVRLVGETAPFWPVVVIFGLFGALALAARKALQFLARGIALELQQLELGDRADRSAADHAP